MRWSTSVCLCVSATTARVNGTIAEAKKPIMGFSTWNQFGDNINESLILDVASAMATNGLQAAGYTYVNLDDAWGATSRTSDGRIVGNPTTFPNGMKALGDMLHVKGFKYGLYTSRNVRTCSGRMPGSLGNEEIDAETFASYGADFVKNDDCGVVYANAVKDYGAMQRAIAATDRPMLHNVKAPDLTPTTAPEVCQIKRVGKDLRNDWEDLTRVFDTGMSNPFLDLVRNGSNFWMDFDMLFIGTTGDSRSGGADLTYTEQKAHFSLWAAAKSPLVVGNDPRHVSAETLAILTNKEVIAINQDPLGAPVRLLSRTSALPTAPPGETKLVLRPCNATDLTQQWTLSGDGEGHLRNIGQPDMCAGVFQCITRWPWWISASKCANEEVTATSDTCTPSDEQHWTWTETSDKAYTLQWSPMNFKHTNCWGTPGSPEQCCLSTEGSNPEIDTCGWPSNASQQRWHFTGNGGAGGQLQSEVDGQCLSFGGDLEVYMGPLSGGRITVVMFNRSPISATMSVSLLQLPGFPSGARVLVRDLWAHKDVGIFQESFSTSVESHGVAHLVLTVATTE